MKKYFDLAGIILLSLLMLSSCDEDDSGVDPIIDSEENIVQVVTGNENLRNLLAALQRTDLVAVLENDGPFTVLAPKDEAFVKFLSDNGYAVLDEVPVEVLEQLLLNHVIAAPITSSDFVIGQAGYVSTLADAPLINLAKLNLFFDTSDGILFNGLAAIDENGTDIRASNGVIHIVDHVLELPTVATFIDADPIFESLEDAMDRDDQPDFKAVLELTADNAPSPFTVFAPTNEAFSSLAEIPTGEALTAILQHHIVMENTILFSDITDGSISPVTLEGDALEFSTIGNQVIIIDGAGNSNSSIIPQLANIQAINGIVHGVDRVLFPDMGEDNDDGTGQ